MHYHDYEPFDLNRRHWDEAADIHLRGNVYGLEDFRAGKPAALNFLKGQVMKLSRGKANPNLIGEILEKKLKA